MIKEGII